MKNVFLSATFVLVLSLQSFASELVSVMKTDDQAAATVAPQATTAPAPCKCAQEEFRAVTLNHRQVRRLNRVADRQEARKACSCGCQCDSTNVLVESNKKGCCCR